MSKRIPYSRKMFRFFAVMVMAAAVIFCGVYFHNRMEAKENEIRQELQKSGEQAMEEFENAFEKMRFAVSYILSGKDVLDSADILSRLKDGRVTNAAAAGAVNSVRAHLGAWYLTTNFNNAVLFNKDGIAISYHGKLPYEKAAAAFADGNYEENLAESSKIYWIWKPHEESWSENGREVISLVQEMKGYNGTYIEIEYDMEKLIFPDDQRFFLTDPDGRVLVSSLQENAEYQEKIRQSFEGSDASVLTVDGEMAIRTVGEQSGCTAFFLRSLKSIRKEQAADFLPILVMFLAALSGMLCYVYYSSRHLTAPVKELKMLVEKRELENIDAPFEFESDIMEVDALGEAFRRLLIRLGNSAAREKKAIQLQLQAQFDALSAGVNPHFIYNVLNVVANRGMMLNDDEIGRICSKLGAILRYSTNTAEKSAPLKEEIKYLDNYFYLLKARFQENFVYECIIQDSLKELHIPRLGLQQLVENSISHGFEKRSRHMKIWVRAYTENGGIFLEVEDNGIGFSEEVLQSLKREMELAKENYHVSLKEFQIGGMGIVNTYLRYYYMYGDNMHFSVGNSESGAKVVIWIEEKGMVQDV
ncbi:MAG: histidine kinase [Eubacteriales bacterium]|nr:histidine kinase [Eubacteriales bacterium]